MKKEWKYECYEFYLKKNLDEFYYLFELGKLTVDNDDRYTLSQEETYKLYKAMKNYYENV